MMRNRCILIACVVLLIPLFLTVGIAAQEREECINVSAGRTIGLGALFIEDKMGFSLRYWVSDIDGSEMAVLVPSGGGQLSFLARALRRVIDTCYIDGIIDAGVEIPLGDISDWQRFYVSGEVEWSFPGFPQFAITLELEVSALHWYSDWYSGAFIVLNFHLYT